MILSGCFLSGIKLINLRSKTDPACNQRRLDMSSVVVCSRTIHLRSSSRCPLGGQDRTELEIRQREGIWVHIARLLSTYLLSKL